MIKKIILVTTLFFIFFSSAQSKKGFLEPFSIGDYYEYIYSEGTFEARFSARIVGEELRNGRMYKVMEVYNEPPLPPINYRYFSFDLENLNIYGGEGQRCPDSLGNRLAISFSFPIGHIWNDCSMPSYFRSILDTIQEYSNFMNFPEPLKFSLRRDTVGDPIANVTYYGYLEKFGYIYFYRPYGGPINNLPYSKILVGAILDGVNYGSILLDVNQISNEIPNEYSLEQNYPNPFNPSTIIKFSLLKANNVSLIVYDQLGREIQTLVDERKNAGTYQYMFNANGLSNGIYFYRLKTDNFVETKKMMLVK